MQTDRLTPLSTTVHARHTALDTARRLLRDALAAVIANGGEGKERERERLTFLVVVVEGAVASEGWREPVRGVVRFARGRVWVFLPGPGGSH